MGFYIEVPENLHKADQIKHLHGAEIVIAPTWPPPQGKVYVCVVENGFFDAAGVAYNEDEFHCFEYQLDDLRPRTWLLMDRAKIIELIPRIEGMLES
jgi:hypothetical protein